jgi:beta-lactamase regulating signal transducer with metallopeptidase domain
LRFVSSVQGVVGRLLLIVWATGAAVAAVKWIARELWLRKILSQCRLLSSNEVQLLMGEIHHNANTGELPRVFISDENLGPCCWQMHRPTILLPQFIMDGSPEDLHHVLIHEMEHLRTNHPLYLFLQQLTQIICWFHPAVWAAACRATLAREYVCDDAATMQSTSCAAYLRTLLRIAERQCDVNRTFQAIGFSKARSEIILRAHRLAHLARNSCKEDHQHMLRKRTIIGVIVLIACVLSQVWIPLDSMSSSRSSWSPWPAWTARAGHYFGWNLRDYERFDRRVQPYELRYEQGPNHR